MGNCGSSAEGEKRGIPPNQPVGATGSHMNGFIDAVRRDDEDIVQAALKKTPAVGKTRIGGRETAAHVASKECGIAMIRTLHMGGAMMDAGDVHGNTALHHACELGKTEVAEYLIRACEADVLARGENQNTPLHLAAREGRRETVQMLLKNGSSANSANKDLDTPLHIVADKGYSELALLLAEQGGDVKLKNKLGLTPLDRAYANNEEDTANLLLPFDRA